MNRWPPFQLTESALAPGVWLIEASAGTGKTFTISGLFLRLVLERDLSVREILVVTFTEAATEELRDRIRRTLADAAAALTGATAENPAVRDILARCSVPPATQRARLERALRAFDEAAIFTIHSFCQRALKDRAFESGALFDTELLTDDSELLQQVADDYWRRRFYDAPPLVVSVLLKNKRSPERLVESLRQQCRHPDLRVISAVEGESLASLTEELESAFDVARVLWREERKQIEAPFLNDNSWAKGEHAKPEVIAAQLAGLERLFSEATSTADTLASLDFFATPALVENTRAKATTPDHSFFARCADTLIAADDLLTGLEHDFIEFARAELPRRKNELKVQSYDDLLTRLRAALRGDRGPALAEDLRRKYRAALIDEFQDTDPVQWEIFRTAFVAETPMLFLIGDPKQAIYGFRGADIFTYLDAARGIAPDHGFTLDQNWRSESRLVAAVNTLFSSSPEPFAFDEIVFQPARAAGKTDDEEPLVENGERTAPLRFWLAPRAAEQKEMSKEHAEEFLPPIVASEIVRLLNGPTRLGPRALTPRDLAVLVMENRQAALMQDALRRAGVPSVLHTEESVFASREARELERVLAALAQPGHARALRAALTTDLLGLNGTRLDALTRDETGWESRVEQAREWHALWLERGFMPMFRAWMQAAKVRQRLLAFDDGDRRLTNLLHLAEVLHAAEHERRLGAAGLGRWLAEQISNPDRASEEHQLRLERDDEAVRLVTVHKSKGLEYPVVFCPFSWKGSDIKRGREDQVYFHLRGADGEATRFIRDLGSPDYEENRRRAFHEKLMENLRLLYVALTRAKNRCYFVWGAFKGAETSAAAWLLHQPPGPAADLKAAMTAQFKSLTDGALRARLDEVAKSPSLSPSNEGAIQVEDLPQPSPARYAGVASQAAPLAPLTFTGSIPANWRITSFSGLVAGRADEQPDRDAEPHPAPPAPDAPPEGIFAFPRGTQAGTCLHKIFEHLDFTRAGDEAVLAPLVRTQLLRHGFDAAQFAPAVCDVVRRCLSVALDSQMGGAGHWPVLVGDPPTRTTEANLSEEGVIIGGSRVPVVPSGGSPDGTGQWPVPPNSIKGHALRLEHITSAERVNELEFCLPLRELTPALLRAGLAAAGEDVAARLGALGFKPSGGFLRGFVDLIFRHDGRFHIVDWKSNWLGSRIEDYAPAALRAEMVRKFYVLQYHLYAVALHEHLKLRQPGYNYEERFGGVFYVFVRGVDPARPEFGVFRDRPAAATIENLSRALSG